MRAKNYVTWLELQQRWRESGAVLTPDSDLASELRGCLINLLREICANPQLEVPYEALFALSNELETIHAGSKATYLLPNRFETSLSDDPTYKSLKEAAIGYVLSHPRGDQRIQAKKRIQEEFGIKQQTVSKWLKHLQSSSETTPISEAFMCQAGAFYKKLRSEEEARATLRKDEELGKYHT